MNYKGYSEVGQILHKSMSLIQSKDFDLIVGISRNGMVPAYMIALYLNKNCCDLDALLRNSVLKTGISRTPKNNLMYPKEAKNILFVDDYIDNGEYLEHCLEQITDHEFYNFTTICIYSSKKIRNDVDLFLEFLPGKTTFEWSIFDHTFTENSCFDIDGVLCVDPSGEQDDDGEKYKNFLTNAHPLFKPLGKVNYLVTSRLEKYRAETETWLKKHGIEYGSLIMLDLSSKEERLKLGINAEHKAKAYKMSEQDLFYESSRNEAVKIHELTKKPVYCIETNEMYSRSMIISEYNNIDLHYSEKSLFIIKMLSKLPKPVYNAVRNFYRYYKSEGY